LHIEHASGNGTHHYLRDDIGIRERKVKRPDQEASFALESGRVLHLMPEALGEPLGALRRELREEIRVGVRRARLIGFVTDTYGPGGVVVLAAVYRVTPTSTHVRPADDVSEARWFRRREIPYRRIAFPAVRRLIRRYLEGSR
jgi:ADP-ribose pyrophosphatase YjhB (NUDIX family)